MSPAKLDTEQTLSAWTEPWCESLVRQIAPARPEWRCPHCDSILYSRRNKLCAVCGLPLPETVRFSSAEASRVNALLTEERQKHRAWMNRGS